MGMQGKGNEAGGAGGDGGAQAPQDWFAFTARRLVAKEFGIAESALARPGRCAQPIAFARQAAMYMAHVAYQLSYQEVADAFGRERTTVAHACAAVEDARDDAEMEERLDTIEERMQGLARIVHGHPTARRPHGDGYAPRPL